MSGAERIAAERQRQVEREGWTADHDAQHTDGSLAWAAVCYAAPEHGGFVRCGAENRAVSDEPCCRKQGHGGAHAGWRRIGSGVISVNWEGAR